MSLTFKRLAGGVLVAIALVFLGAIALIGMSMQKSHAGPVVVARAAPVSVARSAPVVSTPRISTPAPSRSVSSTTRRTTVVPPVATPVQTTASNKRRARKDNDVECSTLKNSRHAADREVYRRYCI